MRFQGIITPFMTSFNPDGSVNYAEFGKNVAAWDSWGLDGGVVNGSGGEFLHTTLEEQCELVKVARANTSKPLLACVGNEGTAGAINACKKMAAAGADGVLVLIPFYWRSALTNEVIVEHFRRIADTSPVPVVLYANPPSTLSELDLNVVLALADHPNIAGVKDSTADVAKLGQMAKATKGKNFDVLVGRDTYLLPAYILGCTGGIVGMSTSMGQVHKKLMDLMRSGDFKSAAVIQHKINEMAAVVVSLPVIPALKALMDILGLYGGPPRAPLRKIDPAGIEKLKNGLDTTGIREEL